jgi:hypothetical protein
MTTLTTHAAWVLLITFTLSYRAIVIGDQRRLYEQTRLRRRPGARALGPGDAGYIDWDARSTRA